MPKSIEDSNRVMEHYRIHTMKLTQTLTYGSDGKNKTSSKENGTTVIINKDKPTNKKSVSDGKILTDSLNREVTSKDLLGMSSKSSYLRNESKAIEKQFSE